METHSFAQPRLVDALLKQDVQQLRCGTRHSIALTAKGEVYTWGFGGDGRLGKSRGRKKEGSDEAIGRLIITMDVFTFNFSFGPTIAPSASFGENGGNRRRKMKAQMF